MSVHRPLLAALVAVATAVGVGSPALAGAGNTLHATVDPAGEQISCTSAELTVTSGRLAVTWHTSQDGRGMYHLAGTNTPDEVVLTDADGRTYELAGASHFTGTSTTPDPDEPITATDVDHFVIRTARGTPLGSVQLVVHLSANGHLLAVDHGSCDLVESD